MAGRVQIPSICLFRCGRRGSLRKAGGSSSCSSNCSARSLDARVLFTVGTLLSCWGEDGKSASVQASTCNGTLTSTPGRCLAGHRLALQKGVAVFLKDVHDQF
eukprot:1140344-Pelagomonas_calceolata.AAC.6